MCHANNKICQCTCTLWMCSLCLIMRITADTPLLQHQATAATYMQQVNNFNKSFLFLLPTTYIRKLGEGLNRIWGKTPILKPANINFVAFQWHHGKSYYKLWTALAVLCIILCNRTLFDNTYLHILATQHYVLWHENYIRMLTSFYSW